MLSREKGGMGKCLNMVRKGYTLFVRSLIKMCFTLNVSTIVQQSYVIGPK